MKINPNHHHDEGRDGDRIRVGDHVTIYVRGGRGIWCADLNYVDEGGVRRHGRKSLGTRNRRIAEQKARDLDDRISEGIYASAPKAQPIDAAIEQFIAFKRTNGCAPKTLLKYSSVPKCFAAYLKGKHHITTLQGITLRHADQFKAHRKDVDHIEPYGLYTELTIIGTFMKWAKKRHLMANNPLAEMEVPKPRRPRHPAATFQQVHAILALAFGQDFVVLATLAFTGLRIGELAALRNEDVDLEQGFIRVRPRENWGPKTESSERDVPIHRRLLPILTAMTQPLGPWFFTAPPSGQFPRGDHHLNPRDVNEMFKALALRCGYDVGRKKRGLTLHALRRFFKTFCIDNGVPKPLIDRWLGHEDAGDMDSHYYRPQLSREWMERVPFGEPSEQDLNQFKGDRNEKQFA